MTLLQVIKSRIISVFNQINGSNKSSYSPEYVRSQNHPNNKLIEVLRRIHSSKTLR